MKRSFINRKIKEGIAFLQKMNFALPPFVYWSPEEWAEKGHEYDEIRDCMLGWDITDFGGGDFDNTGLLLITIRNGVKGDSVYHKEYAEKCLIVQNGQVTPMHFHYYKMEDIINRGGADLMIQVYDSDAAEDLSESPLRVFMDGSNFMTPAGTILRLKPGESITLPPRQYHKFWADGGTALIGEVSKVNDDNTDNHFHTAPARFPEIDEDEAKEYLLFSEYPEALD
jgi:D-lyxose ketol-isomerase